MVIFAVTAKVARGFTILPGLLGKIGARLHPGRPGYLYIVLDLHTKLAFVWVLDLKASENIKVLLQTPIQRGDLC